MIHNDHVFYIMNTDYLFVFFTLNIFSPAKVLLFHEKAFANRTIRLSNRTKVTDYITACGKIDVQTQKIPAIQWVAGMGRGRERLFIRSGSLCLIENQILLSVRLLRHCKICLYVRRR